MPQWAALRAIAPFALAVAAIRSTAARGSFLRRRDLTGRVEGLGDAEIVGQPRQAAP